MEMQAEAERRKRATILDSEGAQQAEVNVAEGARQAKVLEAQGEAAAIVAKAQATAEGVELLSGAIAKQGGNEAVALRVAEQYVAAFRELSQKGTTILLPSNAGDVSAMVTEALTIYSKLAKQPQLQTSNRNPNNPSANNQIGNSSANLNSNSDLSDLTTKLQTLLSIDRINSVNNSTPKRQRKSRSSLSAAVLVFPVCVIYDNFIFIESFAENV